MSTSKKPKNIKSKGKKVDPVKSSTKEESNEVGLTDVDLKKFLGCGG